MWTGSSKFNVERRGLNIPENQRNCVERLRQQVFEIQKRFDLLERTALIFEEMLESKNGVADSIDNTYEGNTFVSLRIQLFRLIIVDIWASVLDKDYRSASIYTIVQELHNDPLVLEAIKAYYADPSCIDVEINGIDPAIIDEEKANEIKRIVADNILSIDAEWIRIKTNTDFFDSDSAKRIYWARIKAVAHFDKHIKNGVVALDDIPPYGNGKLTWQEPIQFLHSIRPYVYDVFSLITATSWSDPSREISRFYAKAFWDRFKNGKTELKPPSN